SLKRDAESVARRPKKAASGAPRGGIPIARDAPRLASVARYGLRLAALRSPRFREGHDANLGRESRRGKDDGCLRFLNSRMTHERRRSVPLPPGGGGWPKRRR